VPSILNDDNEIIHIFCELKFFGALNMAVARIVMVAIPATCMYQIMPQSKSDMGCHL
jgi:hypothetical protein